MVYDILPSENLEYSDIRDTLAAGGGSVNNNVASAFKESAKVNQFSKYKPVPFRETFTDDFPNWYMGDNWFCGLKFSTHSYLDDYKNNTAFTWDNPKGGASSPYRLGDFRGYYAKAQPFLKSNIKKDSQISINYQEQQYHIIGVEYKPSSSNEITLNDLDTALHNKSDNVYLCADIYNDNPINGVGAFIKTIKADKPLNQGGTSIKITVDDGDLGTTRYAILYLHEDTYPITMPIPFNDENYPMLKYVVSNDFLVSAVINAIANAGGDDWFDLTGTISPTNSFINSGTTSVKFKIKVTNDSSTRTINLQRDVNFRIRVTGKSNNNSQSIQRYIDSFTIKDESGNTNIYLGPKETKTIILSEENNVLYDFIFGTIDARYINFILEGRADGTGESGWQDITSKGVFIKTM